MQCTWCTCQWHTSNSEIIGASVICSQLLERLEQASRRACATSTQLSVSSAFVINESQDEAVKERLGTARQDVDGEVGALGAALKNLAYNPERAQAQLRLLTTAPGLLQPGTQVSSLRSVTAAHLFF